MSTTYSSIVYAPLVEQIVNFYLWQRISITSFVTEQSSENLEQIKGIKLIWKIFLQSETQDCRCWCYYLFTVKYIYTLMQSVKVKQHETKLINRAGTL